jgi:type VI protein secretion system component VasA
MCFAFGILDDDPLILIVTGFEEAEGAARRDEVGLVWRGVELELTVDLEGLALVPVLVIFGEILDTVF